MSAPTTTKSNSFICIAESNEQTNKHTKKTRCKTGYKFHFQTKNGFGFCYFLISFSVLSYFFMKNVFLRENGREKQKWL
jgi:hypothetical protein